MWHLHLPERRAQCACVRVHVPLTNALAWESRACFFRGFLLRFLCLLGAALGAPLREQVPRALLAVLLVVRGMACWFVAVPCLPGDTRSHNRAQQKELPSEFHMNRKITKLSHNLCAHEWLPSLV